MGANCGDLFKNVVFILRFVEWLLIIAAIVVFFISDYECYKSICDLTHVTDGGYIIIVTVYIACFFADQINHDLFEKCIIGIGACLFIIVGVLAIIYAIKYELHYIVAILNIVCGVIMIVDLVLLIQGKGN